MTFFLGWDMKVESRLHQVLASCHLLKRTKRCYIAAPESITITSMSLFYHQHSISFTLDSTSAGLVCLSGCMIQIWTPKGFVSLGSLPLLGHSCWNELFRAVTGHHNTSQWVQLFPDFLLFTPVWQLPWKLMIIRVDYPFQSCNSFTCLLVLWQKDSKVIRWQSELSVQWNLTEAFCPWEPQLLTGRV